MPDYEFYTQQYRGEEIPQELFAYYLTRAQRRLSMWKEMFCVTPRDGMQQAEECALCAVAEVLFEFDVRLENPALKSVQAGSVRETYAAVPDPTPQAMEAMCRSEARFYLHMGRWVK